MSQTDLTPERETEVSSEVSPPASDTPSAQDSQIVETPAGQANVPVTFVDHTGKKFIFPWNECKTWQGIIQLIERAYSRSDVSTIQSEISEGKYDLLSLNREVILPEVWEAVIRPGWTVYLSLWSKPEADHGVPEAWHYGGSLRTQPPLPSSAPWTRSGAEQQGAEHPPSPRWATRGAERRRFEPDSPLDLGPGVGYGTPEAAPSGGMLVSEGIRSPSAPRTTSKLEPHEFPYSSAPPWGTSGTEQHSFEPPPPTIFRPNDEHDKVIVRQETDRNKGTTKMPKRVAKKEALTTLGYDFEEFDDHFIISKPLKKDEIDDIIRVSDDLPDRWRRRRSSNSESSDEVIVVREGGRSESRSRDRERERERLRVELELEEIKREQRSRGPRSRRSRSRSRRSRSVDSYSSYVSSGYISPESDSDTAESDDESSEFEVPRIWAAPRDKEGNLLAFTAESPGSSDQVQPEETPSKGQARQPILKPSGSKPDDKASERRPMSKYLMNILESHMISDAVSLETKTYLLIRPLNSPKKSGSKDFTKMRWHHLDASDDLDFYQFKKACSNIPSLSTQAFQAASTLLDRVEKEKIKSAMGGMFIEPGMVLRCDFRDSEGKEHAAIFSCVPSFDLKAPMDSKLSYAQRLQLRLHPARTLMSSLYPYEDVVERDQEQAFRKHGDTSSKFIIHVPLFWMLSIGSEAIVTCGYKNLRDTVGRSVRIEHDICKLGREENSVDIRFRDWEGRVFLFPREKCKTFFQFEQKVRELRSTQGQQAPIKGVLKFVLIQDKSKILLTPDKWVDLVHSSKDMFIDISVSNKRDLVPDDTEDVDDSDAESSETGESRRETATWAKAPNSSITWKYPFFTWKHSPLIKKDMSGAQENEASAEDEGAIGKRGFKKPTQPSQVRDKLLASIVSSLLRELQNGQEGQSLPTEQILMVPTLALVERYLRSDTLDPSVVDHDVDKAFASTAFYESLQECKFDAVWDAANKIKALAPVEPTLRKLEEVPYFSEEEFGPHLIDEIHDEIIRFQRYKIAESTVALVLLVSQTLALYVNDVDISPMLRKVWSAQHAVIEILNKAFAATTQSKGKKAEHWTFRKRSDNMDRSLAPEFGSWLSSHVKRCRTCRRADFATVEEATEHLQEVYTGPHVSYGDVEDDAYELTKPEFRHFLRSDLQMDLEERHSAFVVILSKSVKAIAKLRLQAVELLEGVSFEKDTRPQNYELPLSVVESLRRFVVLFLGVERSICFTDKRFDEWKFDERKEVMTYCTEGLTALQRFESSVHISLSEARKDLCFMVRSPPDDTNYLLKLSLGPEFILAWLMRRFLLKPIINNVGAPELYRDYLSALSFQVNHHPRKRLLRDINLLQEELLALDRVNEWQIKLVENYIAVLDDNSFATEVDGRRALFEHEKNLLLGCLDHLQDNHEDYGELLDRCQPLSETTKQSTEINEEDHGKAIFVFTLVTIIFLPLSFVTSYLGMNTADIRNMNNKQSLFWEIALPLTAVTIGSILFVAYNGDSVREALESIRHVLTGKKSNKGKHSLSVAERKRITAQLDSSSTLDYRSAADSAEYAMPVANPLAEVPGKQVLHAAPGRSGPKVQFQDNYYDDRPAVGRLAPPVGRLVIEERSQHYPRKESRSRSYSKPMGGAYPTIPEIRSRAMREDNILEGNQRPTYARVHKKHVTPDSLAYFGLPWEFDTKDPDYMIITKDIDTYDLDVLFEHSRRVTNPQRRTRSGHHEREMSRDDGRKPEYAWIRKPAPNNAYVRRKTRTTSTLF